MPPPPSYQRHELEQLYIRGSDTCTFYTFTTIPRNKGREQQQKRQ